MKNNAFTGSKSDFKPCEVSIAVNEGRNSTAQDPFHTLN